ncbi:MAG TPA: hypothetical protein VF846_16425 [Thermoanaerobaculia bacterium]|jgi:hypothetical protein
MRTLLILVLLAGCAAQPGTTPPANTPPPPIRPENAAVATGVVTDASGRPVAAARVTAWAADGACQPVGNPVSHITGADGRYQLRVEAGVGPQFDGCVVVRAAAGGSTARAQQQVHYAPASAGGNSATINLLLPQPPFLTRAEADRLIETLRAAMQGDEAARSELALYINDMPNALTPISRYTRGIESFRLVSEGDRRFVYQLTGRRPERNVEVTISQDVLTRIELPKIAE